MTTRKKRTLSKALSFLLALLMTIYVIPMSVFANDITTEDKQITDNNPTIDSSRTEDEPYEDPYVLGEVDSLRTESSKTFRLSDGTFAAVEYGQRVHFKDENDQWQDYDNTLTMETNINAEEGLKAGNVNVSEFKSVKNDVNIKFSGKGNATSLFTIKNGKYSIEFNLTGADKNAVSVKNSIKNKPAKEGKLTVNEAAALDKIKSSIKYEEILKNTDIEYILYGDNIKENIIVKEKNDSYVYDFTLDLKGVVPQLNEDGSIYLLDENTKEVAFTIPSGYMFDAKGQLSNAVKYSLKQSKNKSYSLTVTADATWINDENRAFPVTIDPAIGKGYYGVSESDDGDVRSNLPSANTGSNPFMITGYKPYFECGNMRIYIKLNTLPTIPDTSVVVHASLNLIQRNDFKEYTGTATSITLGARKVTSAWTENTLT